MWSGICSNFKGVDSNIYVMKGSRALSEIDSWKVTNRESAPNDTEA